MHNKTLYQRIELRQKSMIDDPQRVEFDDRNREIIEYCRPDLAPYLDERRVKGQKRTSKMYTSKVTTDLETAADAFVGNVFLPEGWFGYSLFGEENDVDENQAWMQSVEKHFSQVYIDQGFYDTLPPIVMDKLSIGEGLLFIGEQDVEDLRTELDKDSDKERRRVANIAKEEAGEEPLEDRTETVAYFEYVEFMSTWWTRDRYNRLDCVHNKFDIKAWEAFERWGEKCSAAIIKNAEDDPLKTHWFIHSIYKKTDPILKGIKLEKDRPFVEFYTEEKTQIDQNDMMDGILEQSGYKHMPFVDWPHWLKSGESIGRGPLGTAITTVKRLHSMHKDNMLASQRRGDPPLKVSATLKGRMNLRAGGKTYLKNTGEDLTEVYRGTGYAESIDYMERTEKEIEEVLGLPFFLSLLGETKRMTIPELMERIGERAAAMAPRLGLGERIFLSAVHQRLWDIEEKNGRIPPAPSALQELIATSESSIILRVRYKGPLSLAQEQLFTQRKILGTLSLVQAVAPYDPQAAADKIDVATATEHILDEGGFYQDSIRTDEEVAEIAEARNDLVAQQAQVEQDKTDSETAKNLSQVQQE